MRIEMVMPQMGESIAEATISKWLKQAGEAVEKDQVILEISTDKVDSEIPAPASGVLTEVLFKEGDVVPVKTIIALIDTDGKVSSSVQVVKPIKPPFPQPEVKPHTLQSPVNGNQARTQTSTEESKFFSPLVMSLAAKHSVNLDELQRISGTGQGGRVTKQDLLKYLETRSSGGSSIPSPSSTSVSLEKTPLRSIRPESPTPSVDWSDEGTKVVPMDNMRQLIAEHMVRSKHTSPHVYSIQEVDMTPVSRFRQTHKEGFQRSEGFGLSFTPFFMEAGVKALLKFPYVNCSLDGKKIILKKHINLGCAVAIGDANKGFGLIVPVIKKAEEKTLTGLARSLNDLANRARTKKLLPDDVAGGTFSITNPGVFGTMIGSPIINQPQVAILCLGAIKKKPVVIDDMIAIREMCYLTLSYDHRIIDGALAGQFLAFIRDYLEGWDMDRSLC